ncbi:hypothetical protein RxyAA322_12830 [Rubrobacter xylanophilus]|uniref:Flavoprotein domain-containing protein n=1 Tax=Rubrobacter xylanophilus TaxID=49319 RepID=A0A510HHJ9_9ACTN|nr:flavoprotein [Rubrobacter xylanophilus]BBL79429.1 hypothetical protein RxyAA322_12830 [Rubrobacter xylanophilus]
MDTEANVRTESRIDRLLVGVSGSVAVLGIQAYLAAFRALLADEVRVIMTDAAAGILPPSTVALFCDGVFTDGELSMERRPGHVELSRWAEEFVVIPATANLLGMVAHGIAPNLLTSSILASPRPVIFCPNANDAMWRKKAVQRNVRLLQEDGHKIIQPELTTAFEVASGEMRDNWVVPGPEELVERLQDIRRQRQPVEARVG